MQAGGANRLGLFAKGAAMYHTIRDKVVAHNARMMARKPQNLTDCMETVGGR